MHEHTICDMSIFRRRYEDLLPDNLPVSPDDPIRLDNLGYLKHFYILSRDVLDLRDEGLIAAEVASRFTPCTRTDCGPKVSGTASAGWTAPPAEAVVPANGTTAKVNMKIIKKDTQRYASECERIAHPLQVDFAYFRVSSARLRPRFRECDQLAL